MFLNRNGGRNNIVGVAIARRREAQKISQRQLADNLGAHGIEIDKNAVQRIESGQRFVTDIELAALAAYFGCTTDELIKEDKQ